MKKILNETIEAYADCTMTWEMGWQRRNLSFKASAPVSRDEAIEIANKAIPGGYNAFKASKLKLLPVFAEIILARENSVCVYVTPPVKEIKAMEADEWNTEDGVTRIWWD